MAKSLESLAVHYDQMDGALRELEEGGEPFSNEELQGAGKDALYRLHSSLILVDRDEQRHRGATGDPKRT